MQSMYFPRRLDQDVTLTLLTQLEAESFYELVVRNREHLSPWLAFAHRYESVSDAMAFARDNLNRLGEGSAVGCLVWYREQLAGWVELLNIDHSRRQAEIAFWLGREFQHKGTARRAATAMIEHAFTGMDFPVIQAHVNPDNIRSRALLDGLGFDSERRGEKIVCQLTREAWARSKE